MAGGAESGSGLRPEDRLATSMAGAGIEGIEGIEVMLVLGSGLGAMADSLEEARPLPFGDLEGMPRSAVPGHAGRFVVGRLEGVPVLVQQGRVHLYEGWSAEEATRSVRAAAKLGVRSLVLTNAAGGMRPEWPVPSLMRLTDHLNLTGRSPLRPGEGGVGCPYDDGLGDAVDTAAKACGVDLHRGVYVGLLGPTYETPAEIRHLTGAGADAVGMSTVCEALAANAAGMRVAAISCITNPAAGIATGPLNHEEVVDAGAAIAERFETMLRAAVPRIAAASR